MSKSKADWVFEKDEMLIELVKNKPQLFDISSTHYSDNVAKKRAWNEIGNALDKEGSACKERWESLRSQYRKNLKKKTTKSGHAATKIRKWRLHDQMSFLTEFMKDRTCVTSIWEEDDSENKKSDADNGRGNQTNDSAVKIEVDKEIEHEITTPIQHQTPNTGKRHRKKYPESAPKDSVSETSMTYLLQKRNEENAPHPIDTFFSLMASTVKNFNLADQHYIKTKVFSLVSEIEWKYLSQTQQSSSYQYSPQDIPHPHPSPAQCSVTSSPSSYHSQQEYVVPHQLGNCNISGPPSASSCNTQNEYSRECVASPDNATFLE